MTITRKRALELAKEALQRWMDEAYSVGYIGKSDNANITKHAQQDYAELAAALDYIERLARQKELL